MAGVDDSTENTLELKLLTTVALSHACVFMPSTCTLSFHVELTTLIVVVAGWPPLHLLSPPPKPMTCCFADIDFGFPQYPHGDE